MKIAKFITQMTVINGNNETQISVYEHPNGGIFGMDSSFVEQCCDDDSYPVIPDPFSDSHSPTSIMLAE